MHDRSTAAEEIAKLEELVGVPLSTVPLYQVDQWGAGVRDMLAALDVDLSRETARAALGGAYLIATLTLPGALVPESQAQAAAHVLRWLYDRGEGTDA